MQSFDRLLEIIATLRGDGGCEWDRNQTHKTLRTCLIEEAYEVSQAIVDNDAESLKEELGDLMLIIVLLSRISEELNDFTIDSVLIAINEKLIRRHPHVFSDSEVKNSKEILAQWERIKTLEREAKGVLQSGVLNGVPENLPAMVQAYRLSEKAARVGFEYEHTDHAFNKIQEEMLELQHAYSNKDKENMEEEIGDCFMTLINFARMNQIDPETALINTNRKFRKRFGYIEKNIQEKGNTFKDSTLEEMLGLWADAKQNI